MLIYKITLSQMWGGDGTMHRKTVVSLAAALAFSLGSAALTNVAQAGNFWDMMDPGRCFGNDDRDWGYRGYGPGRYYAGGPYDWGDPYRWGGYPGYYGYPHFAAPRTKFAQQKAPTLKLPE